MLCMSYNIILTKLNVGLEALSQFKNVCYNYWCAITICVCAYMCIIFGICKSYYNVLSSLINHFLTLFLVPRCICGNYA